MARRLRADLAAGGEPRRSLGGEWRADVSGILQEPFGSSTGNPLEQREGTVRSPKLPRPE